MQGCARGLASQFIILPMLVLAAGCDDGITIPPSTTAPTASDPLVTSTDFDPETTGTLRGRVIWQGDIPKVKAFTVLNHPLVFKPRWPDGVAEKQFDNPNAPVIDAATKGIGNAVVFLREVDLNKARPWAHAPVRVAFHDYRIHVAQGNKVGQTGFVRRGDQVEFVSKENRYHSVRARGAAFFTLTLPRQNQIRRRRLNDIGLVELSSAAEYYWLCGWLFVAEHPYFAQTNPKGEFEMTQVPKGVYQLVAWMPNWNVAGQDRNSETTQISRLFYQPPVELSRRVQVRPNQRSTISFTFSERLFRKGNKPGSPRNEVHR